MKLLQINQILFFLFLTSLFLTSCSKENVWDNCTVQIHETKNCAAPQDILLEKIDCEIYRLTLLGDGEFGTTIWNNTGVSPNNIQTDRGILEVSLSDLGTISKISGQTQCCKGDESSIFDFDYRNLEIQNNLRTPQWLDAPPETAFENSVHLVLLANAPPLSDNIIIQWTSSNGISIQGGESTARIMFTRHGVEWIKVTYIDMCTQEEKSIQQEIVVI